MGSQDVIFNPDLEVIGHRGHLSHFPENTIEGFLSAVSLGVDAIEMDVVISADKKVVVSHEPFMAAATVITPAGKRISRSGEKDHNIYKMPYDSIRHYIIGMVGGGKYRKQQQIQTYKPLLHQVFSAVEDLRKSGQPKPITYYLEVKSRPEDYGIFQPHPDEFADLIMQVIEDHDVKDVVVIKSFDAGFLNTFKEKYPAIRTSVLLYRTSWQEKLNLLEFDPEIISPHYEQLERKEQVEELQEKGFKVIPWTVNSKREIKKMINLGVDGIISDYPERVLKLNQED